MARAGAADLIVVKVAPLGGVRRALDIVAQAGLPAVVSSALDTSVGIRAGLALAAALPELPYACGLGTVSLFAADVTLDPLVADDGAIRLRDVAADAGLLERVSPPPDRRDWWLDRLRRVHASGRSLTPHRTLSHFLRVFERSLRSCRFTGSSIRSCRTSSAVR